MDRQRVIEKLTRLEVDRKQYKILKELGRGGNGVALLCEGSRGDSVVAKVYIPPDHRDLDDKALERFENEIELTKRLKHPNIVPSLGSGATSVGAYRLPFYLMPHAAGTLRSEIRNDSDPAQIEKKLRMFLRAAYGVACLHSHGVVHRDLKPENILINKSGVPWVADLGIAHVNPEFVSVGLKTIESERLLNRDYFAPEQRFGKATEIDKRADIYALGCIFYEMLTSIPPVRTNPPKLSVVSSAYGIFESVWERMTAWNPDNRYQTLEDALEDLSILIGWVLATLRGSAGLQHPDIPTMIKLLRQSNEAQRQRGVEIALRLGKSALPELHNLLGHTRRDIRNSAAIALGEILDSSSIPYLIGGLYGTANTARHFRPSIDTAAQALSQFPADQRIEAFKMIKYPVRLNQIRIGLEGIPKKAAYEVALLLRKKSLILVDWSETDLELFVEIDEKRAWPEVKALVGRGEDFQIRSVLPHLSTEGKVDLICEWVENGSREPWSFNWIADGILELQTDPGLKHALMNDLERIVQGSTGKHQSYERLLKKLKEGREEIENQRATVGEGAPS